MKQGLQEVVRRLQVQPGAREFFLSHATLDPASWSWPVIADVTLGCKLRCRFCHRVRFQPDRMASERLFERLASEVLPHASEVAFGCRHEPLLHPDLPERIRALAEARDRIGSGTRLCLLSSGMPIDAALARRLAASRLDSLLFSFESSDEAVYARLRAPATFDELRSRIQSFLSARTGDGPSVTAQSLVLRSTVPHLASTVEAVAGLGIRRLHVSVVEWAPRSLKGELVSPAGPEGPWLREHLSAAVTVAGRLGIAFRPPEDAPASIPGEVFPLTAAGTIWDESRLRESRQTVCASPWAKLRVDDRGDVFPCVVMVDPAYAWGNILRDPFAAIVNGEVAVRMRTMLAEGRAPNPVCARCTWGPGPS